MDSLGEALKRRKGIVIVVDGEEMPVESQEEAMEVIAQAMPAKDPKAVMGFEPFENNKEKSFEVEYGDDDDGEDSEDSDEDDEMGLSEKESKVADPRVMERLKNGAKPKGLFEKMQANLMKKKGE